MAARALLDRRYEWSSSCTVLYCIAPSVYDVAPHSSRKTAHRTSPWVAKAHLWCVLFFVRGNFLQYGANAALAQGTHVVAQSPTFPGKPTTDSKALYCIGIYHSTSVST